jgi:hypothetical protein
MNEGTPIPDTIPQVGPGTLAVLRANEIGTSIDLLYFTEIEGKDLAAIPGIGHARAALLMEWAREVEPLVCRMINGRSIDTWESMIQLAGHKVAWVSEMAFKKYDWSESLLTQGSTDANVNIRKGVAAHPNATVLLLSSLSEDPESSVRKNVAKNPNTPASLLASLAQDPAFEVLQEVASNPNTPFIKLEILSQNRHLAYSICWNPSASAAMLDRLQPLDISCNWAVAKNIDKTSKLIYNIYHMIYLLDHIVLSIIR